MSVMTLMIPDDLDLSIRAGADRSGMSLNAYAYIVRGARRQAVLDAVQHLAELDLGDDLCGEGDAL